MIVNFHMGEQGGETLADRSPDGPDYHLLKMAAANLLKMVAANLPLSNNPYFGECFIVRKDDQTSTILDEIRKSKSKVFCVSGGPGYGKTTFAKHVGAKALNDKVVSAVYFHSFSNFMPGDTADKTKRKIANAILKDLNHMNPEDPPDTLGRFCKGIDASHLVLFILDNVETLMDDNSKPGFCDLMANMTSSPSGNVHLLLTTRDTSICRAMEWERMVPPHSINLPLFDLNESREFLEKFVDPQTFSKYPYQIATIIKNCHGNALGLNLCASILRDRIKVLGLVVDIGKNEDMYEFVSEDDKSLETIISTSFEKINDKEKSFMQAMSVLQGSFSLDMVQEMLGIKKQAAIKLVMSMVQKSLIDCYDEKETNQENRVKCKKYIMHPFIRSYCRNNRLSH
jgi:hypothetical protein